MIDTRDGNARLFDFLPKFSPPIGTLASLSGDALLGRVGLFASGLQQRVAAAWNASLTDLTCGQVRMLVGQRLGLPWLAHPVATFVAIYPDAECDLYPGDLAVNALACWRELNTHAPAETLAMIKSDFRWLEDSTDELAMEARDNLAEARAAIL